MEIKNLEDGRIAMQRTVTQKCLYGIVKELYDDGSFDIISYTMVKPLEEEGDTFSVVWKRGEIEHVTNTRYWTLYDGDDSF